MLSRKQLKRMAKPYSDKQIVSQTGRLFHGSDWWSNAQVAFLSEVKPAPPASYEDIDTVATDREEYMLGTLAAADREVTVRVYPVRVQSWNERTPAVMLSDGNGKQVWVNARYLTAVLKRGRNLEFYATPGAHPAVVARNGHTVAVLVGFRPDPGFVPDWELQNLDVPVA